MTDPSTSKPVSLTWKFRDAAKLRITTTSGELRPIVQFERFDVSIEAITKSDDKIVVATEVFRECLWSGGATYISAYPNLACAVTLLAGSKTKSAEVSASYNLGDNLAGVGGVRWTETKIDPLTLKSTTCFLGIAVGW